MATANHGKRLGGVKARCTGDKGNSLLACIDNIGIDLILGGIGTHAENTIL